LEPESLIPDVATSDASGACPDAVVAQEKTAGRERPGLSSRAGPDGLGRDTAAGQERADAPEEHPGVEQPAPPVTAGAEFAAALSVEPDPDAVERLAAQSADRQAAGGSSKVSEQWEPQASKLAGLQSVAKESANPEQRRSACLEQRHESAPGAAEPQLELAECPGKPRPWPLLGQEAEFPPPVQRAEAVARSPQPAAAEAAGLDLWEAVV